MAAKIISVNWAPAPQPEVLTVKVEPNIRQKHWDAFFEEATSNGFDHQAACEYADLMVIEELKTVTR